MQRYQKFVHITVFIILVMLTFNISYNPFTVNESSQMSQFVTVEKKADDFLREEIKQKAASFAEEPQDAYIDRVWKKTPGRNGIEVDIDKSYEKMKEEKVFDESLLVYKQISPNTSLKDLPPAPIYRGHPEKEMVSFLINVSWGTEYIPDILNILKQQKVKATFFVEGKWANENAELVKMIDEQGHIIGNHAYNHPDMARISSQEIIKQIEQTNNIIEAIIGKTPKWFAPPSGSYNDEVVKVAYDLNMETILWTVDSVDWKKPSVSVMMNRIMKNIHPGAMILMHPTSSVAQGLSMMIEEIKHKGYKIDTVEKLLSEER